MFMLGSNHRIMTNKIVCVLLFVSLTTLAFACEKDNSETLLYMQRLWHSQVGANYSYVVEKKCFCSLDYTREMLVSVIDNNVVEAQYRDTGEKVSEQIVGQLLTIPGWFDEISKAIGNESGELEASYDSDLGYPVNIKIDRRKMVSDDEFDVIISKVLKQ